MDVFALRVLADQIDESGDADSAAMIREAAGLAERYQRALQSSGMNIAVLIEGGELRIREYTIRTEQEPFVYSATESFPHMGVLEPRIFLDIQCEILQPVVSLE